MILSIFLTFTACTSSTNKTTTAPSFSIMNEHPTMSCLNSTFDVFIDVFGIYVVAPNEAPEEYILHTANVLAEYLDNDADGMPDDALVLEYLVNNQYIIPVWSQSYRDDFWSQAQGTSCEDGIGMAASMYYDEDQWALGGIASAGTWDTNLEEVWHVVSAGWYAVYPDSFGTEQNAFGEYSPSKLLDAMDVARGGQFLSVPTTYPQDAWYTYYDETCDYVCQAHEYFYWILMANIDALDPTLTQKCTESQHEWNICSKQELERQDTLAFALLNEHNFALPTNIPQGAYSYP